MKKLITLFLILTSVASFAQEDIVYIPDSIFKSVLLNDNPIDINHDGEIQVSEASAYSGELWASSMNISDMTGIEAFTAITTLNCAGNLIDSLDLSNNTALWGINCSSNINLTYLNVSKCTALTDLFCRGGKIKSLDLSNNTDLLSLKCGYNQLSDLDLSNNTLLMTLQFDINQLTTLDISNNNAIKYLGCAGNQLSSLDLSGLDSLSYLACDNNYLTSLDLSNNTNLDILFCSNNQLTSLDLSKNTALENLYCENNQLNSLNFKNRPEYTIYISAQNNPDLYCIEVDDMEKALTYKSSIDPQTSFSTDCSYLSDATLSEVIIDGFPDFVFDPDVFIYDIEVPNTKAGIPFIAASLNNSNATMVITQATSVPGIATIEVTSENGLNVQTYTINFIVPEEPVDTTGTTDINTLAKEEFNIYPNPTSSQLNIEMGESYNEINISINDISGREVFNKNFSSRERVEINIEALLIGVYFLDVVADGKRSIMKIIKE